MAETPSRAVANVSSPLAEAVRDIIAGTIGGIAGRVVEFPFDTIKTKLQAASLGEQLFAGGDAAPLHKTIGRIFTRIRHLF
jgi:hypothetical protein